MPLCHNLMLQFLLLLIPGRFLFCNALKLSLFFSLNEYLECGLNEKIFKLTENSIFMGCLRELYFLKKTLDVFGICCIAITNLSALKSPRAILFSV